MAEYIERQRAIFPLYRWKNIIKNTYGENDEYVRCLTEAIEKIENVPSADVQPVVRCKECQNSYEWANADGDNYRYCCYMRDRWNHDYDRMVDDDDFCKWGRKMDGGET